MATAPPAPVERISHTKILATLIAGFLLAAAALIATNLLWAQKLNQNEIENESDIVKSVLEQLKQGVGYTLLPEANWDEAYTMFASPIDLERVRSQVGPDALRALDLEGIYVFDPTNKFAYGIYEGNELENVGLIDDTDFSGFAGRVRNHHRTSGKAFLADLTFHHEMLHVIAGAVINPTTESLRRADLDGQVMIVEREIPLTALAAAGQHFMIGQLELGVRPGAHEMAIYNARGHAAAAFSWIPKTPGRKFLLTSSTPAFFVLALLAALNVIVIRNWTAIERKLQAARLHAVSVEQAGRTRAVLLSHLSHELRTPLNAIIGFAQLIRYATGGTDNPNAHQRYALNIETGGHKLLSIIDSVLELARIERGEFEADRRPVDLESVLTAVVGTARTRGEDVGVAVTLACPDTMPDPLGDERALQHIFSHLLDNALRFSPRGGTVSVDVGVVRDGLEITVHDRGSGMSPEVLARVAMPFALPQTAMTQQRQGVGMGLALCHALCNELGARIRIESAPGKGTSVFVLLPMETGMRAGSGDGNLRVAAA